MEEKRNCYETCEVVLMFPIISRERGSISLILVFGFGIWVGSAF